MNVEQIKEQIKLKSEVMKFYFIILIGVATGTLSLLLGNRFDALGIILMSVGFSAATIVVVLIRRLYADITNQISKL